jgi:putative transposase
VIVAYISCHRDRFGVEPICAVLSEHGIQIAPSTYYARLKAPVTAAELEDAYLVNALVDLHRANWGVYGARKLWHAARRGGLQVGRDQVGRLMGIGGITGAVRGRHRTVTTESNKAAPRHPDLVKRGWTSPIGVDQLWVADFSYVWTLAGFVYVAFVVDVFSRRILGWRVSGSKQTQLVLDAFRQALHTRHRADATWTTTGLVHHSDAGSQGGFKWSSQHLQRRGVHVVNEEVVRSPAAGCGSGDPAPVAVSGSPAAISGCGAGVLAVDRPGRLVGGGCGRGGRVDAGGFAVVPPRWRHVTHRSGRAHGPVSVVRRT